MWGAGLNLLVYFMRKVIFNYNLDSNMFGILVCGDSISFGRGESPNISWVGRLKNYFEPRDFYNNVFNLGVPGDVTTNLLVRFETEINARINYTRPENKFIIMLAIGLNDSRGVNSPNNVKIKLPVFEKNIIKLIKIAKEYTNQVVVIGLTPVNEDLTTPYENTYLSNKRLQEYDKILENSAMKYKVHYVNILNTITKLNYKKLLVDGVHPNKKGYDELYKIIKKYLIDNKLIA